MIFTLNLSNTSNYERFIMQARHYLNVMPVITYFIYVNKYGANFECSKINNSFSIKLKIAEVMHDINGNITQGKAIIPLSDDRFSSLSYFKSFKVDEEEGECKLSSIEESIHFMINIVKFLKKLDKISLFI